MHIWNYHQDIAQNDIWMMMTDSLEIRNWYECIFIHQERPVSHFESGSESLFGVNKAISPWKEVAGLPLFLKSFYTFYETNILGVECIILESIGNLPRIEQLEKHLTLIASKATKNLVVYHNSISPHRLKMYLVKRIPFIIGTQHIFLPFLGLKMTNPHQEIQQSTPSFSPITQCIYLMFFYDDSLVANATSIAQKIGISIMSASRALNVLSGHGLLSFEWTGPLNRSKIYRRIERSEYLSKGLQLLKSPFERIVYSNTNIDEEPVAGLEALSQLSTLNPPLYRVRAVSSKRLSELQVQLTQDPGAFPSDEITKIQLWRYDPRLFSTQGRVDPLSLYASLKEESDERVAHALKTILL
jgi:hypothetical protein